MRFKPKQDNLIALELDIPGAWSGETILTVEEAEGLREELDRCIKIQAEELR